jgi:hypothetical protein
MLAGCKTKDIGLDSKKYLSAKAPVNVFEEQDRVILKVNLNKKENNHEPAIVSILDFDGNKIAQKEIEPSENCTELDFGVLPVGYYEALCNGRKMPFSVIIVNEKIDSGKINVHSNINNMSPCQYEDIAELLKKSGVDYFRTSVKLEELLPERNIVDWIQKKDENINIQSAFDSAEKSGVKGFICFHDTPQWARKDHNERSVPDNLFDAYNSAYELARHFKGKIEVYEPWNEPDGIFYNALPDTLAAYCKAFYLGVKDADESAVVTSPSFTSCRTKYPGLFLDNFLDNDLGSYMDVFNYHHYGKIDEYAETASFISEQMEKHKIRKACWVTECSLPGNLLRIGKDGRLSEKQKRKLCSWMTRSRLKFSELGVDKIFWFALPYYTTPSTGASWGLLNPVPKANAIHFTPVMSPGGGPAMRYPQPNLQESPTPAFSTLNNLIYILGEGKYLGKLRKAPSGVEVYALDRGDRTAAVVVCNATDSPASVNLPWDWKDVIEYRNIVGTLLKKQNKGRLKIKNLQMPVFIIMPHSVLMENINLLDTGKKEDKYSREKSPDLLQRIVCNIRFPSSSVDKKRFANIFQPGEKIEAKLEICNFSNEEFSGYVNISLPQDWTSPTVKIPIKLPAKGRKLLSVPIAQKGNKIEGRILTQVFSNGGKSSVSASPVLVDPDKLTPKDELLLPCTQNSGWKLSMPKNKNAMGTISAIDNGVKIRLAYTGNSPRWGLGMYAFPNCIDLSKYNALRFDYRTSSKKTGNVKIFLTEPNGARYSNYETPLKASDKWKTATVLFKWLGPGNGHNMDKNNGKLDKDRINEIGFGMSPKEADSFLEIKNIKAVSL